MQYLYKQQCKRCVGVGLIELKTPEYCKSCKNVNKRTCYLCQNKGGSIRVKECEMCSGYGELFFDNKTNIQQYLYALQNYKIIS